MLKMTRRTVLGAAAASAAFGLASRIEFVPGAWAATGDGIDPVVGHHSYKIGDIEVTALYDGVWRKPHDPAFIKNATVDDTKQALRNAGLPSDFMPIPVTVLVLKMGGRLIMMDAGSGAGQWQANATHLPANMAAAGIDYRKIDTIMISHFHPDHVWGLMEKGSNKPIFPNAELVVHDQEYKWWMEPGRVEKLPDTRKAAGKRIATVFPQWKNWKLVAAGTEVAPGIRLLAAPGHTAGHSAYVVASGSEQMLVSGDIMYVPALLAPHPDWQGVYDQDPAQAVLTRKTLIDMVIADGMKISGSHFPFPGSGTFVKGGNAYGFTPTHLA